MCEKEVGEEGREREQHFERKQILPFFLLPTPVLLDGARVCSVKAEWARATLQLTPTPTRSGWMQIGDATLRGLLHTTDTLCRHLH